MTRRRFVALLILFLMPIVLVSTALEAQDTIIVNSKGVGDIFAGRKAMARDVAVEDALHKAVEWAVGLFLSSETIVQSS